MRPPERILLIADIEGSSGCWDRQGARFMTRQWREACIGMSRDVDAVVRSLFQQGVAGVDVIDFHRTGYNLLPEFIDRRASIRQGYPAGPVAGIGQVAGTDAVMFIGMHAASGTPGFLAHTLTSRIAALKINGRLIAEVELVASVLAPYHLIPRFFSGCPVACDQASSAIPGIRTYPIDKSTGRSGFDAGSWRRGLAESAAAALDIGHGTCPDPGGPFKVEVEMRDSPAAEAAAKRWGCNTDGAAIHFEAGDATDLFLKLIRICYFNRLTARFLNSSLLLYRLIGRLGWLTARYSPRLNLKKL
jgi:D-amino peptidase